MNGGASQSDRVLIDAFNAAIEARAKTAFREALNIYDDGILDDLHRNEFETASTAKARLRDAGIDPAILSEILL